MTIKQTMGNFKTLQLLDAYELAIDCNIITSIADSKGFIVYANQKFCDVSKYTQHELIGQDHRIINSAHHPKAFFADMWQTIGKGNLWHKEIKNKAKDGTYYWVDTVIVPILDEEKKITHYLSLRTLITDRKLLEEKNAQYLSSLEILLVMTSNKIKRPLATCLKQMNTLDKENIDKNEIRKIVENLKLSTTELIAFTNELDTFIRDMEK